MRIIPTLFLLLFFLTQQALSGSTPLIERYKSWISTIPKEIPHTQFISVVVISEQLHYLFKNHKLHSIYAISTGSKTRYKGDRRMPQGTWRLGKRLEDNLDAIYGAKLIFMEKYLPKSKTFVQTRKAFHGTNEPEIIGSPQSMGCVYHYDSDIIKLYDILPHHSLIVTIDK